MSDPFTKSGFLGRLLREMDWVLVADYFGEVLHYL